MEPEEKPHPQQQGAAAPTIERLQRVLDDNIHNLGEDHPDTLTVEAAGIARALAATLGLQPTVQDDHVSVYLPAIDDTVRVFAGQVQRFASIFAPNGDRALEFVIGEEDDVRLLIITADDVVFAPEDPVAVLDSTIPYAIANVPHLIAYSEMEGKAEKAALAAASPGADLDLAAGDFLLVRCCIASASRFGLRPIRTVAWWDRGWAALAGDVPLPPFRPDPVWDDLVGDAAQIIVTPSVIPDHVDDAGAIAALTVADFREMEPRLRFVQLDDEFASSWKSLMPITPSSLADTLLAGLSGAEAEVALYPDGGGSVDMRLRTGGETQAILQLRFSFQEREMAIDEIRIAQEARGAGLYQRMMFNSEQLARRLGLSKMSFLATDIGSVAMATVGSYPKDGMLARKFRRKTATPLSGEEAWEQDSDEAEPSPPNQPPPA